ncbi:MAG: protoporphyrinogen oxidase [Pyrinomonadaceae bacterium]|nr:protoporphyrinogen oxidase [Pyrinomonadaceae bacterium]
MKKVCIIGGGISGLTTGFLLKRKGLAVTLFEKSDNLGGNIQTITRDGYTIEQGPNSLLKALRLIDLVRLLNIEDKVIAADENANKRYILSDGKLEAMGVKSFVNGYFSLKTILSLAREPFVRSKSPENESVAEFVTRRISSEFLDKAIDPFVSGVYAGDPNNLSMRSAFPKLYEMERDHGSLIAGTLLRKVEKPDPNFPKTFSFKGGLKTLIDALANELGDSVKLSTGVEKIENVRGGKFSVNGEEFDAVVISTPSYIAGELIKDRDENLTKLLSEVNYPQVAVVVFGVKSEKIKKTLDGFGFLIPSKEKRPILGTLFHSAVFPERSPKGFQLLMTFVGGVRRGEELDNQTDEELKILVREQLGEILGLVDEPDFVHIKRWKRAIPQYRVGYENVTEKIAEFEKQNAGIYFCSNFYRGISMSDCVKNAFATAEEISHEQTRKGTKEEGN